tara:strand:+ start:611 stop:844 length:234 start_codon:yes stop_codon:yes gene_type:complete
MILPVVEHFKPPKPDRTIAVPDFGFLKTVLKNFRTMITVVAMTTATIFRVETKPSKGLVNNVSPNKSGRLSHSYRST